MSNLSNVLIKALISLFALAMLLLVWQQNADKPRILIVHSYNTDLSWVRAIDEGIDEQLQSQLPGAQIRRHYMDLKNHNGCSFQRRASHDVTRAISDWQPDYLLIVDDIAQQLVGAHYLAYADGKFPETSLAQQLFTSNCPEQDTAFYQQTYLRDAAQLPEIVFAGVNSSVAPYGYFEALNTQGIYEHKNFKALAETLSDLQQSCGGQDAVALQPLNDSSATALREKSIYGDFDWQPLTLLEPITAADFEQWQKTVAQANEQAAMILVANYQQVRSAPGSESFISPAELIAWTEQHARYPVLGAGTDYVSDGGMISVAIAGKEQGQTLAQLVKFPPQRASLNDAQVLRAQQFLVSLSAAKVQQRCGERLPGIYSAFAKQTGLYLP